MKKVFQQLCSVVMAVLVLLSTISWSVDKHLCMGRVMDVSFFSKADDCGMEAAMMAFQDLGKENHCCDDESFTMTGQDDLKISWSDFDLGQQFFLLAFTSSYLDVWFPIKERPIPNETYPPPLLVKDIQVLHEVFLI